MQGLSGARHCNRGAGASTSPWEGCAEAAMNRSQETYPMIRQALRVAGASLTVVFRTPLPAI